MNVASFTAPDRIPMSTRLRQARDAYRAQGDHIRHIIQEYGSPSDRDTYGMMRAIKYVTPAVALMFSEPAFLTASVLAVYMQSFAYCNAKSFSDPAASDTAFSIKPALKQAPKHMHKFLLR